MEYEKIDDVVFVYVFVTGVVEPIFRQVYDSYEEAVNVVQKIAASGIMAFDHQVRHQVYYPAHRIDRCEQFRAKKLTTRVEKSDSHSMSNDAWHGHYEDLDGNKIYY